MREKCMWVQSYLYTFCLRNWINTSVRFAFVDPRSAGRCVFSFNHLFLQPCKIDFFLYFDRCAGPLHSMQPTVEPSESLMSLRHATVSSRGGTLRPRTRTQILADSQHGLARRWPPPAGTDKPHGLSSPGLGAGANARPVTVSFGTAE